MGDEKLVKSRLRVADHGEVFTPRWLVDDMLDLVKGETERIDSRFLEPACGSGNFLVPILERKLATVQARYGKSAFEKRHYALFALMCVYGIELLGDNAAECRENLEGTVARVLKLEPADSLVLAARAVLAVNIVQGDALEYAKKRPQGFNVVFAAPPYPLELESIFSTVLAADVATSLYIFQHPTDLTLAGDRRVYGTNTLTFLEAGSDD